MANSCPEELRMWQNTLMWIARISRNRGDKVNKDELRTEDISELLEMLTKLIEDENDEEIMEIHIYRGKKENA